MMNKLSTKKHLGFGIGLRPEYYDDILTGKCSIDWLEILTENYLVPGGKPLHYLDSIREQYPMVMHGVSLSIGGTDPLDKDYLKQVKALASRVNPAWISDHLCWTGVDGINAHDLLPLPYTEEALQHVVQRVEQVQEFLGQQILLENVSSYVTFEQSGLSEWEFLSEIAERADCLILLDVNNVYVSSINHRFNAVNYIHGLPKHRIQQIHIAGHSDMGDYIIDTHDDEIVQPVWDLYEKALAYIGPVSTMIERDDNFPPIADLLAELDDARLIAKRVFNKAIAV